MRPVAILMIMAGIASAYTFMDQGWSNGDPYQELGSYLYADEFVACDGTLGSVRVWASDVSSVDLTIQVYQGETEPTGAPLYQETIETEQDEWESIGWPIFAITVDLPSGWNVSWGQTYWLAVQTGYAPPWDNDLICSYEEHGYPCMFFDPGSGPDGDWSPRQEGTAQSLCIMIYGEVEGSALESNTWGAIKALW